MIPISRPAVPRHRLAGAALALPRTDPPVQAATSAPWPRTTLLRAALLVAVLIAFLLAMLLGSPSPRYLADPALARLLRGIAMVKGLIAIGAIAALWWRAAWPGSVRTVSAALAGVSAQVAATVWIVRLVAIPWAAGLFHVGLALLMVCAWREHHAELARQPRVSS